MKTPRTGFSTGACAAAAAKAATLLLCDSFSGTDVDIPMPDGSREQFHLLYANRSGSSAEAAVRKDAGDDPDVTDGSSVIVAASFSSLDGISFTAGEGVGTVTLPGLSLPPGEPAINPVPRRMIREAVREVTDRPLGLTVSIPGGRELAEKTFNPRLGISGGLSILGTSGRVRPFSAEAMRTALLCSVDVCAASGTKHPILVPGRIGKQAAERHFAVSPQQVIEIGNEWGLLLERVAHKSFSDLLILGHPGKLAKLANGQWDTHSSRSRSAVEVVSRLFEQTLTRPAPATPTVEGLFSVLSGNERQRLGDRVATEIRAAIRGRIGEHYPLAIVLTDMKSEWIGAAGDLSPWQ